MTGLRPLARALNAAEVRYVVIGVFGASLYAHNAGGVITTVDQDLFLPPDPDNLLAAWRACEACELELTSAGEPLGSPRDRLLAGRVVERQALTRASGGGDLQVDLALVMKGFDFDTVWSERTVFQLEGVELPAARLRHIVASKAAVGRPKDHLFIATHLDALQQLYGEDA
jgi:hypothetical protein